jgi:hypothetical protein
VTVSTATPTHPAAMSAADRLAHDLASYVRPKMAEHEKTKDELPRRPRGPHPQRVTAAA